MLRLSKKSDYALIALKHIASKGPGGLASAKEIAEKYNLPRDLLAKVMQSLARGGLIVSQLGAGGGYRLAKAPGAITLKAVIKAIDGPIHFLACYSGSDACDMIKGCSIRKNLGKFEGKLTDLFDTITIEDL
jgi:Rrf2 family protein